MQKNKRKIIGVDFDDVIFSFNDSLHAYHNKKYGTNITIKDVTTYDIDKIWNCTPEEASEKVLEFMLTDNHDVTPPISGAIEALKKLSIDHELHLISSRGDMVADTTLKWIDKNFPNHFKSIQLTNQYLGVPNKVRSKSSVCHELGVEVMIEDSLSQVANISPVVKRVILLDCPWNQGELPENVTRVYSWDEILENIMQINIKKLHQDAKLPAYAHHGDAGMDFFALERTVLKPGEHVAIRTGISMEIPRGFVGLFWDKSGLSIKEGLKLLGGVIDAGYRGEIMIGMINLNKQEYVFETGHKVAQMLIQKVELPEIVEVEELGNSSRGRSGFGSTGK